MTNDPKMSWGDRLRARVSHGPVPAARSASVLTQLLFGMLALTGVSFDAWCLGWLSMNAAANAVVTAGLVVAAFYGMSLERYYRGLQMPRLTRGSKRICVAVWIALGILASMTLKYCGFIVSTISLLGLLYLFFAFLGYLISRERPQELRLLGFSTLFGLLGWFIIYNSLICIMLRYFEGSFGANYAETLMPGWYITILAFFDNHIGVTAMLLEGALLILADWWLRLKVFSLRSGESIRSFFNWQAMLALLCFFLMPIFHAVSCRTLASREQVALNHYRLACESAPTAPNDEVSVKEFIAWQEQFGRQLSEATRSDLVAATRSPFQWRQETAARWLPCVETPEEHALLEAYLAQMKDVLAQLPERLKNLPPGALSSDGLLMILAWRQEAAVQLHDSAMAAGCLTWARMLVDAQLKATSTQTVAGGLGNVSRVVRLAERLLECFGDSAEMLDHVKRQLQELLAALQNPGPQAVRQAMSQYLAWKDLALHSQTARWGTPFGKLAWLFPAPRFLMAAETAALAEAFAKADSFLTLEYPERMYDGPMVRILMQPLAGNHHSLRSLDLLAQSRIQALLVLTAVVRYRLNHAGALPPALAALVPECLDELPADPLAAGQPYRLTQEEISLQVWNFHQAGIETVKRGALVVRSTNSSDVLAMLLLTAR